MSRPDYTAVVCDLVAEAALVTMACNYLMQDSTQTTNQHDAVGGPARPFMNWAHTHNQQVMLAWRTSQRGTVAARQASLHVGITLSTTERLDLSSAETQHLRSVYVGASVCGAMGYHDLGGWHSRGAGGSN